ncbi:hypothetical protein CSE16_20765 [Solibacillus sp. R5-41]|uniref:DUF4870 domain-containing protein n=1 Tax=Solibacillus sp. R5-41 TaxID=2048654 RepID=UPI000C126D84|nr:DUF4870 domain-containing protein [Solibacillus sp. R5-41]ATP42247.1 hypothetical protein CSE16_20765 [Solibacillus sp. R5-41]
MESKWSKVIIHASAFFAPFLVPILFFIISTEEDVKRISMQALLFQVIFGIFIAIAGVLSFILIGLPFLLIFLAIFWIAPVIGIFKALSGSDWNYPIVGRWV